MTDKETVIFLSVSAYNFLIPAGENLIAMDLRMNTDRGTSVRLSSSYFAMRRSGVRSPSAPPAENTDRMGIFCASEAAQPDEFSANSSSNSSSSHPDSALRSAKSGCPRLQKLSQHESWYFPNPIRLRAHYEEGLELANVLFRKPLKYWANSLWVTEHCGT
jgi:hypothetical protein